MKRTSAGERICPVCRVTVLSRYNSDPLCAVCVRAARDSAGIVPTWLWDSYPMREALARVDLAAFVVIFRATSGLSQMELGDLVEGWSQTLVCLTEQGKRETIYDIRKLLAFADTFGMPRVALAPLILGHPGGILEGDNAFALQGVDTVNIGRRELSFLAAGLAAAAVLPVPERVGQAHVRYLQAALNRLRILDDTAGGGAVLSQALRHFGHARRMLDESDYTEAVGQQLLVVTADLGIDSAWSAYDADHQGLARRLYEQSTLLVDSAGDNAQRAYLYANLVQHSTFLARHTGRKDLAREALRFAERAEDTVRHEPSPALRALVWLRRSLAHAQLGDATASRAAITTARRELDRGPHETDTLRTRFVRHSEITGYEALSQAQLGAFDQALRLHATVLQDTTRSPRDQAIYRASLAGTLLAAGHTEQAIGHGLKVLPQLGAPLNSARTLRVLRPLRNTTHNSAGAAEFCERFDTAARTLRAT